MIKEWIRKNHIDYADYTKPIIMYVDASREWGYGIALYQFDDDSQSIPQQFDKSKLRPIMFISRDLKPAEFHYYPDLGSYQTQGRRCANLSNSCIY
jgi:RNase H-like domain found in reverse transcriptase